MRSLAAAIAVVVAVAVHGVASTPGNDELAADLSEYFSVAPDVASQFLNADEANPLAANALVLQAKIGKQARWQTLSIREIDAFDQVASKLIGTSISGVLSLGPMPFPALSLGLDLTRVLVMGVKIYDAALKFLADKDWVNIRGWYIDERESKGIDFFREVRTDDLYVDQLRRFTGVAYGILPQPGTGGPVYEAYEEEQRRAVEETLSTLEFLYQCWRLAYSEELKGQVRLWIETQANVGQDGTTEPTEGAPEATDPPDQTSPERPAILVNGLTRSVRTQGTTFRLTGVGFAPGWAVRHVVTPDAELQYDRIWVGADGLVHEQWATDCTTTTGTYTIWLVDSGGTPSNEVSEVVRRDPSCTEAPTFEDPDLEAAVRDAIGKPEGALTSSDLLQVWRVSTTQDGEVTSLVGIENCTNLMLLTIGSGHLSDLTPLSRLRSLQYLELSCSDIADISALSGLTRLRFLGLNDNDIHDISPLSALTDLERLELGKNQISRVDALSNLRALKYLILSLNSIVSVTSLSGLTQLETLWLDGNRVVSISALSDLRGLQEVLLDENAVSDLSPLVLNSGLGAGDYVSISDNNLDLSAGSQASTDIETLIERGVDVQY